MVPKIENILFISDLSDNSRPALAWSMMLAHRHEARITFLHVIENVHPQAMLGVRSILGEERWNAMTDSHHTEIFAEVTERIHGFCNDAMADMPSCPLVVDSVIVKQGVPIEVILNEVGSNKYDLVALGSDSGRLFRDAGMNNIARRVFQRGKIPMFVFPAQEKEEKETARLP